jgi:hypothetical protein
MPGGSPRGRKDDRFRGQEATRSNLVPEAAPSTLVSEAISSNLVPEATSSTLVSEAALHTTVPEAAPSTLVPKAAPSILHVEAAYSSLFMEVEEPSPAHDYVQILRSTAPQARGVKSDDIHNLILYLEAYMFTGYGTVQS